MDAAEKAISEAYVDPEERVLDPALLEKSALERMPQPTGWRILVLPYGGKQKTKGGIHLAETTLERQQVGSNCGMVLKMGSHCYDKERYPEGPWCKKGDWVLISKYSGHRFEYDNVEMRLLNDDAILATLNDPTKVSRATT